MNTTILNLVILAMFSACNGAEETTELPAISFPAPVIIPMGKDGDFCRNVQGEHLCDSGLRCAHELAHADDMSWNTWRCIDKENGAFEKYDVMYSEIDVYLTGAYLF